MATKIIKQGTKEFHVTCPFVVVSSLMKKKIYTIQK